jgi:pRiA4b ORF-3-like protein
MYEILPDRLGANTGDHQYARTRECANSPASLRPLIFRPHLKPRPVRVHPRTMPQKHARSRPMAGSIYQLRIALQEIQPPIWRRLQVPHTTTLAQLHGVIQDAMGWQHYHLYRFTIRDQHFEQPDPEGEGKDATGVKLRDLAVDVGETFEYVYDFGDDWHHDVTLEDRVQPVPEADYPLCMDGARACPPEDCGGPGGYAELLQVLRKHTGPQYTESRRWIGNHFHPECFDLKAINRILMLAHGGRAV